MGSTGHVRVATWPKGLRYAAAGAVVAGLALSSCANSAKVPPAQAVENSLSKVGSQSEISLTLSLPLSQKQIEAMGGSGGSTISPPAAQSISTGSIFIDVQTGHGEAVDSAQSSNDSQNRFDVGLQVGSTTPFEFRYVDQDIYLKAAVDQLLTDSGGSTSAASSFASELEQVNTYVPGISALGQDQWVEITHESLQPLTSMAKQFAASEGAASSSSAGANQSQILAAVDKLRTDVLNALSTNSTYKDLGNSGGRTHYQLTLQVKPFVQQAGTALQNDLAAVPGESLLSGRVSNSVSKATSQIPAAQTAVVDVYVENDKVQEIDLDANQFDHQYSFPTPIRLVIGQPATIEAPANATQLDLSKLPALLGGLASKLGNGA